MTEELRAHEVKNVRLFLIGIILLAIGLGMSFYNPVQTITTPYGTALVEYANPIEGNAFIPFDVGIVFIALGFLYPTHKTQPQNTELRPQ